MEDTKESTNHSPKKKMKKITNKPKIRKTPGRDAVTNVMLKNVGRMTRLTHLDGSVSKADCPKWICRIRKN